MIYKVFNPSWLDRACQDLDLMVQRGQAPQAVLIHGAPGTGRRYIAQWLARLLLRVPADLGCSKPDAAPGIGIAHPDFFYIEPPPDKNSIGVDQVRDLIGFLQLTSHRGGGRVVVLSPAESMTHAAANSLLKTLEEPPPNSTLILIAAAPAGLPATILSRCHRVRVRPPSRTEAMQWLSQQTEGADLGLLLDLAGGGPFAAFALFQEGFGAQAEQLAADLRNLRQRRETPLAVARKWSRLDRNMLSRWLYIEAARAVSMAAVRAEPAGTKMRAGRLQNDRKPTNMQALFARLRESEELYRNQGRALNIELQLGGLLQHWYGDA
jgi:DNA polymerase-3 subunit delta'